MKAMTVIVFMVLVLVALVWLAGVAIAGYLKRRALARTPWEIEEHSTASHMRVQLEKPGQHPVLIAAIDHSDPDYWAKLEQGRADAYEHCIAYNTPTKFLRR